MQSTGEDWKNTSLTLSTATQNNRSIEVPKLPIYRLKYKVQAFGSYTAVQQPQATVLFGGPVQATSLFRQSQPSVASGGLFGQTAPSAPSVVSCQAAPSAPFGAFGQTAPSPAGAFGQQAQMQPSTFGQQTSTAGSFGNTQPRQDSRIPVTVPQGTMNPRGEGVAPVVSAPAHLFGGGGLFGSSNQQGTTSSGFGSASAVSTVGNNDRFSGSEDGTIVQSSLLSTTYTVEGAFNVPSDGAAHTVSISASNLEATVTRVCVPRINPAVMLQCRVKNTSEYRLLPGAVSIFLNDSFVTRTFIGVCFIIA